MCTSSTATPAATGGSASGGAQRNASSGRSRLPPAASASLAHLGDAAAVRADRRGEPVLDLRHVLVDAGQRDDRFERGHCSRPRVQRDDAAAEAAVGDVAEAVPSHQLGQLVRAGEAADARRQVRVGLAARQDLAGERDQDVEPELVEELQRPLRLRDLEDADAAARLQHAPQLGEPALEVGDVADAEADGRRVERAVLEGQLEQVALDPLDRGLLPPRALEHARREVEADHLAGASLARGDGEVARAAAAVEHAVAGRDDLADGQAPPALVEPDGHDAVHQVVDGRDPVEHRADALGRQRSGLVAHDCPQRATSVLSSPSWSRIRATMKSTRSSIVSAPW